MNASNRALRTLTVIVLSCLLGFSAGLSGDTALAASVTYTYDEAGRLKTTVYDDGTTTSYDLDAAGNRKNVGTGSPPGPAASISVPTNSTTGSYNISWTAGTGTITRYDLYEATASNFSGETVIYSGTGTSKAISGKANGAYYYRVRAVEGTVTGEYSQVVVYATP